MPAAAEAGDSTMQTSPPPPPPIPPPAAGKAPLNDSNSVALSRPVITDQSEQDASSPLKVIGSHSPATQSPATGNPLPVDSNSVAHSLNAITDVSEMDTSVPLKAINSPSPSKNCTTNMYNSELIEGKSVKSTKKRPRLVGNEVRKRSLRSRTVVIRDSPLRKSSRLSSVKCRLLALPEGLLASERRVSKKAKIDSGKRVFNGEENRNEAALPRGSVSGKKVSKMVKNDSGKRVFNGGENGSAVAIRPVGSESGLVKVPTIFGDGRGWEEIGSYFEPCLVEFSGNDDKLEEIGTSSGPESAYGKTLEEIRGYFEEVEEMETKPCLMGLSLGDEKIEDIASYSTTSGLSGKHLSSQKVQCEELKSGIELFDFSLDGGPRDNQETFACVEEKMSEQVPIIGGVGNSLEEVRTYFEEIKEVETEPCLMELFVSDDRREEIEANSYSSGLSRTCLSTREVQCKESKSGIESFDFSPYGSLRDNQETHACIEEKMSESETPCSFVGEPVLEEEAQRRWGWRYELKNQKENQQCGKLNAGEEDEIILNVKCHYTRAKVNDCIINLGDCALIKGDGREKHVGKILEFFQTTDGEDYFRVQWFYRAEDTVMQKQAASHDKKRLFYSTVMNDNMLDCIISKVSVIEVAPTLSSQPRCFSSDFYYDTEYCVEYSTFRNLPRDDSEKSCEPFAPGVSEAINAVITSTPLEKTPSREVYKPELALLDLYSGCGGMSTGLCLGAKLSSVNLVTRWAVDANQAACDTLKLNHPETLVRKQNAEDFLELLKEWHKLCQRYVLNHLDKPLRSRVKDVKKVKGNVNSPNDVKISAREYVVQRLVDICYGDPCKTGKPGIKFKVRWLGYGSSDDTWEPIEGLSNCQERIEDFVKSGYKSKILPLPGDVDVLCGGPPCQGISGYNRHRNVDSPLTDERNRQIIVFMDIVKFLRPKYVLMENVNDILKFDKASLGRYAISRLIHMKYQARLGNMASGCYGLPQFRLRVFLWGALPSEKLPQFPLPSHDVVVRYWPATEFERNTVAYDEGQHRDLEGAVVLRDAISDLQAVTSHETREQMSYELPPETEFQKFIRLTKDEMMGFTGKRPEDAKNNILYDHRPLSLPEDDILRVSQIPHKKGANFRDLPGVIVRPDNVAYQDPKNELKLPSGKPLVPNSAFAFDQGKSKRPYARVWWDENVATIVTYPNIHAQAVLHPEQDRVFTIREFARLQGFPDYYRFCGSVVERYRQVGNAVSVPVARALGYCLGIAIRKLGGDEPLMTLPPKFAFQRTPTDEILLSHK